VATVLVASVLVATALLLAACQRPAGVIDATLRSGSPPRAELSIDELDALTNAYSDRFMTLIVGGVDSIMAGNTSPEQRRMAHLFKTASAASIYDIATNPDPFTQLIDMLLVVTLLSQVWIDEARADDVFGDRADLLVEPLRRAREDIWSVASRVMRPEQLEALDMVIWTWRRQNADVQFVSFVRFDDFASDRTRAFVSQIRRGGGLLAPIDEARLEVERARRLAERAFFYAKRVGFLAAWEAESVALDLLVDPSVRQALEDASILSASIDRASATFETLPDRLAAERETLIVAIDERHETVNETLREVRGVIVDSDRLTKNLTGTVEASERLLVQLATTSQALGETVRATDQLVARFDRGEEPSEAAPFDIDAYNTAISGLAEIVRELNALLAASSTLMESDAWPARLHDAAMHGDTLVDRLFRRAMLLIAAFFAMLLAYRIITLWLRRHFAVPGVQTPVVQAKGATKA